MSLEEGITEPIDQSVDQNEVDTENIFNVQVPDILENNDTSQLQEDGDEIDRDFFNVQVPDIIVGNNDTSQLQEDDGDDGDWYKVKGWYNELSFYSKVFQFFVEDIKESESKYGWWIILISSFTSFTTLFTLDPFNLTEENIVYYTWIKNLVISIMTIFTTLIATWVKKKGYVKRIQAIDKRIARLEKFIGFLDYQFRLVPRANRQNYLEFITKMRDEHNELSIYSNLISPSEFTRTMYIITKYNAPLVRGAWPWYNTTTQRPRPGFARNIIRTYEKQYSYKTWLYNLLCCCRESSISNNPLLVDDI
jgi:hypothetical protein